MVSKKMSEAGRRAWKTRKKIERDQKKIKRLIDYLCKKLKEDYKKIYSEHHLQAYIYKFLKDELPRGWNILVEPTLSKSPETIKFERKAYKGHAKNIPQFFIPDLIIYRGERPRYERKPLKSKEPIKRIDVDRKNSFAIELIFRRPRYGNVVKGIRFVKIKKDRSKYSNDKFTYYVLYINQHRYTRISKKSMERFNKYMDEDWFRFIGEPVINMKRTK